MSYKSYDTYKGRCPIYEVRQFHVISMRLPVESGKRLRRMANRHGWTPSDASARLVEEGLRRSEFAFVDFRDSAAGRQAYIQGSTLAVWIKVRIDGQEGWIHSQEDFDAVGLPRAG